MALVIDTGPLIAALDAADPAHRSCRRLLESSEERRVIPAPILPEVDYWCTEHLAPGAFRAVLADIRSGALAVEDLRPDDYERVDEICDQYADLRVGFVDAAVLAVVERLAERKLATLDRRHFSVMRPRHVAALHLLPEMGRI